jgi:hypothetical protein
MRLNFLGGILAVLVVAALIIGYSSLFTVFQTQQALVIRLGQPVRVVNEPGLNVKAPFIDSVVYIDKRILDLEAPSQEVIARTRSGWRVRSRDTAFRIRSGSIRHLAQSQAPTPSCPFSSIRRYAACWAK